MSSSYFSSFVTRRIGRIVLAALLTLSFAACPVSSRGETPSSPALRESDTSEGIQITRPGAAFHINLFPPGTLFPVAIADPHRTGFGIQIMNFSRTDIADSGDQRFNLQAGGRFGIFRVHPREEPDRGWQFSVEGGFDAQFDMDHALDNIGWDGNYGFLLEHAFSSALAFKIAAHHTSSHVGDEYAERIGRKRIQYTRHEIAGTVSWRPAGHWRLYAEAARGYNLRNEILQEPGRVQMGLEYEARNVLWSGKMGWYAAADLQAWEERDWRLDSAVQAGFLLLSGGRAWRFGIEYVNGRATIGEFFRDTEQWISYGLWIDI